MGYRIRGSRSIRQRYPLITATIALAGGFAWSTAQATPIPLGFVSWDVTIPGSFGQFDIVNETGPNSNPPTWPVTTEVQFNSLSLTVHFSDGSITAFGPSYFTLNLDGESLDGSPIAIGGVSPKPTSAVLTGDLTPTAIIVNGTSMTVNGAFDTATITDTPILVDGDFAIINAETGGSIIPEPNMMSTLAVGSFLALMFARQLRRRDLKKLTSGAQLGGALKTFIAMVAIFFPAVSFGATTLHQNTASNPGSGVAGVTFVNITATGFPSATINPSNVTIRLAPTCTVGAVGPVAGEADATATSVKTILANSDRVHFEIPPTLLSGAPTPAGTYLAQIVDTTDGFAGGNCSIVVVTASTPTLSACIPSSSLGVVTGARVTAYVPNGWLRGSTTGLTAVPIEGGGSNTPIPTTNVVNSCVGNPATMQVICIANNTDVYLIDGSTSPPAFTKALTSGLTGTAFSSGGGCSNCGVAINAATNTAAIAGGAPASLGGGDGVQILDLNTNTFKPVFKMTRNVSEEISIDPGRNLILSPDEFNNNYPLLSLNSSTGAIIGEFDRSITTGGAPDSAAEDCSTGIALSSVENTLGGVVYAADLSQATFATGSPGSWTSPFSLFSLTGTNHDPGLLLIDVNGISVAQGASHLAIITEENERNIFGALRLQSAPGSGNSPPTLPDYVSGVMPSTPDGLAFSAGLDPHTVTAYTSPNTGSAIGLYVGWTTQLSMPKWIGVIDLAKALAATRTAGTHMIDPSVNLLTSGIVTYVKVQ